MLRDRSAKQRHRFIVATFDSAKLGEVPGELAVRRPIPQQRRENRFVLVDDLLGEVVFSCCTQVRRSGWRNVRKLLPPGPCDSGVEIVCVAEGGLVQSDIFREPAELRQEPTVYVGCIAIEPKIGGPAIALPQDVTRDSNA